MRSNLLAERTWIMSATVITNDCVKDEHQHLTIFTKNLKLSIVYCTCAEYISFIVQYLTVFLLLVIGIIMIAL